MTYNEVLAKAREVMAPKCRVCKNCDGRACRGEVPGTGGVGNGEAFISCPEYLKNIRIHMDAVHEDFEPDIQFLWDRNVLKYMHYETVWFVNSALLARINEYFEE